MSDQVDRRNYDVVSIGQGKKRANHVQSALEFDYKKVVTPGKFIKVFADMFLKKEVGNKAYF